MQSDKPQDFGCWAEGVDSALLEAVIAGLPALTVYAVTFDLLPDPTSAELLDLVGDAEWAAISDPLTDDQRAAVETGATRIRALLAVPAVTAAA